MGLIWPFSIDNFFSAKRIDEPFTCSISRLIVFNRLLLSDLRRAAKCADINDNLANEHRFQGKTSKNSNLFKESNNYSRQLNWKQFPCSFIWYCSHENWLKAFYLRVSDCHCRPIVHLNLKRVHFSVCWHRAVHGSKGFRIIFNVTIIIIIVPSKLNNVHLLCSTHVTRYQFKCVNKNNEI